MNIFEALILGLLQGLTEFLPISSSGHLELGQKLFGLSGENNLTFTVVVHGATVLSTIVVFFKEIWQLLKGSFELKWNEPTQYLLKIALSMIPVLIIGLLYEEQIEQLFSGNMVLVGSMLLVTAGLLAFTWFKRDNQKEIGWLQAFIIGVAQAIAVIPGISRSGATISTGLLLGVKKEYVAKFSFLMVLVPVIGANILKIKDFSGMESEVSVLVLLTGFIAAFISGLLACSWMINIVKKGKLIWFAVYCFVIGLTTIILA
jgi:undecaprenyl-diphosphatase